jgi:hypothetical protein
VRRSSSSINATFTPIERFQNHTDGDKAAYQVQKYGSKLLPQWYEYRKPIPYSAACQMEKDFVEDLSEQDYTVWVGPGYQGLTVRTRIEVLPEKIS